MRFTLRDGGHAQEPASSPPLRAIVAFHADDEGQWVAELRCGHTVHMRHDPPWQNRPWVVTEQGRRAHLAAEVPCIACTKGARA